jgi:hypothetical protein
MSVPARTEEQRADALAAALVARRERAQLRAALKSRALTAADVIRGADERPAWASVRVSWLLESIPGVGAVRATRLMDSLGIAASRRIQGLGERQRVALLAVLDDAS